jgi:hypothetical protein
MYNYETEKMNIFTDDGQKMFLKIRDNVFKLIKESGAVKMGNAISGCTGSSSTMIACVDRMVELEEIKEVNYGNCSGQDRVFIL